MKRQRRPQKRRHGRRVGDYLAAFGLLLAVGLATAWLDKLNEQSLSGTIHVVDGDSIRIDGREIRLTGIDAPEFDQTCQRGGETWHCGRAALSHLKALVRDNEPVQCRGSFEDKYQRLLAVCEGGDADLNARMVLDGLATAYGNYDAEQAAAKAAGRGLWAGEFQRPQDFRAQKGDAAAQEDAVSLIAQLRMFAQKGLAKIVEMAGQLLDGGGA